MPEKTLQNINRISFLFFAVLGATHLLAMLSISNGYMAETAKAIYQILDIPFLLATLIYGGSAFKIGLNKIGLRSQVLTTILVTLLSIIFLLTLYINFFFPDS
ncbi:MAG: hypothetical protein ACD_65C00216G0013 [uncultured bacterium]|nr:MAG: hypothetical protein ACD_65C00216G0013 [uncultured bacterium]OGJ48662.1 MAG: hypothetical protein A2244_03125 [Candidatus Peregrinibacteria bacterium RIFOXYA2_FULL_41_18]OGJ52452.1 MAG: hypothetical protein A2448_03545 [Candidatus Peregrinibacteria bacterium RIFOXYC2_FULL_41_22]